MQNSSSIFHHNLFKLFNFAFVYFNSLIFKFIQLKSLHQLLLNVVVNCPKLFFFQKFLIKNPINDWKIFLEFFLIKKLTEVDGNALID